MGWAVYYALNRAAPLAEAERATLIAHAERWTSHPWQSEAYALHLLAMGEARRDGDPLAWGWTKLPSDPEHPDVERLLEALSELHGLIEGASVAVQDDLHSVGWTARGYALDWAGRQPEVSLPESGPR
jgi:hypothetical protein